MNVLGIWWMLCYRSLWSDRTNVKEGEKRRMEDEFREPERCHMDENEASVGS